MGKSTKKQPNKRPKNQIAIYIVILHQNRIQISFSVLVLIQSHQTNQTLHNYSHQELHDIEAVSLSVNIIVHILSRLPVKSLVRFRCVCKSWNSMLNSPSFIRIHLDHWSKFHGVYVYNYDDDYIPQLAMYDPEKSQHCDLDLPINIRRGKNVEVIGSCNGVLCLSSTYNQDNSIESKIFLWNPFINELELLPEPPYQVSRSIGFGWDDTGRGDLGELKVVNINVLGRCSDKSSEVEVFSQRKNSWAQLGNALPSSRHNHHLGPQVNVKNFICWCPCVCADPGKRYAVKAWLVLFDVSKEKFHEEELPDTMQGEAKYIAVLDGCLSLIAQSSEPEVKGYEVWMMKKFGKINSWTKLYAINTSYDPCHRPLGFTSSGKVVFMRSFYLGVRFGSLTYLVLYDCTRDEFDSFHHGSRKGSFHNSRLVNHVASLVSPLASR